MRPAGHVMTGSSPSRLLCLGLLLGFALSLLALPAAAVGEGPVSVTCQGILQQPVLQRALPEGIRPEAGLFPAIGERLVVIESPDTRALPSRVRVFEASGELGFDRQIPLLSDPVMSPGGRFLALRSGDEIWVIDTISGDVQARTNGSPFAVGPAGETASVMPVASWPSEAGRTVLLTRAGLTAELQLPTEHSIEALLFESAGDRLLLLADRHLIAADVSSLEQRVLFTAEAGWDLRDLLAEEDGTLAVGLRRIQSGSFEGAGVRIDRDGRVLSELSGTRRAIPVAGDLPRTTRGIPWPLTFNNQYPIGNTYGEFQYYGGAPYMHPGVDIMSEAGEPIFAVEDGWVKAVLTTSGSYHWRVAIGDTPSGDGEGYLYAHLDEGSITVDVGDHVQQGEYLGGLVEWPVADFTHIHFARIADSGSQWYGSWLCTDNPHLDLDNLSETDFPVFERAVGDDLLAFCVNETSNYLDPGDLHGEVDIIAHIGDQLWDDWVCTVQEIRYSIYPAGNPDSPIVDDKLGIYYDMALDTYQGGPIDPMLVDLFYKQDGTCETEGDYDNREFYYIITNSDGDLVYEESDFQEAWNTAHSPNGDYMVRVTALDATGNATVDSMLVTTDNGISGILLSDPRLSMSSAQPNPTLGESRVLLHLTSPQDVQLAVFDAAGRRVRPLTAGVLPAGEHSFSWDGRDAEGQGVSPGIYFYRLQAGDQGLDRKVVVF